MVSATTYNKDLIKAQFIENINCLRCYNDCGGNICDKCPVERKEFFPYSRNKFSSGSQTPQTNIDLASFETFERFFEKLNIKTNKVSIESFKEDFKKTGVSFPMKISELKRKDIVQSLINDGCYWLK